MLPVLVYFFYWFTKVWKDVKHADFKHTMRMNLIASAFTNMGFYNIINTSISLSKIVSIATGSSGIQT
jgi:hypothetical protein